MSKAQMTITVPTEIAGEVAVFTIEFLKSSFSSVMETVDLLVKPSDVYLAAEMGEWVVV